MWQRYDNLGQDTKSLKSHRRNLLKFLTWRASSRELKHSQGIWKRHNLLGSNSMFYCRIISQRCTITHIIHLPHWNFRQRSVPPGKIKPHILCIQSCGGGCRNTLGNNIFGSDSGVAAVILYCGLASRDYLQIPSHQHHYPPVLA